MGGLIDRLKWAFRPRQGRRLAARLEEQLTRTLELVVDTEQLRGVIMGQLRRLPPLLRERLEDIPRLRIKNKKLVSVFDSHELFQYIIDIIPVA